MKEKDSEQITRDLVAFMSDENYQNSSAKAKNKTTHEEDLATMRKLEDAGYEVFPHIMTTEGSNRSTIHYRKKKVPAETGQSMKEAFKKQLAAARQQEVDAIENKKQAEKAEADRLSAEKAEQKRKFDDVYYKTVYPALRDLAAAIKEQEGKVVHLLDNDEYKRHFKPTGTACRDYIVIENGGEKNFEMWTVQAGQDSSFININFRDHTETKNIEGLSYKLSEVPTAEVVGTEMIKIYTKATSNSKNRIK